MSKNQYPYQHIYERDNFTCQYCGWSGKESYQEWWIAGFCIDHIKPIVAGGTDEDNNLVVSCHNCNLYKGATVCESFDDARQVVAEKRAQAERWFRKHVLKQK